jgi:UDP-N-acetylglucosamine 2-epimerase
MRQSEHLGPRSLGAVHAGTVRLVGTDEEKIVAEATQLLDNRAAYELMSQAHNPYGDGLAQHRILAGLRGQRAEYVQQPRAYRKSA